MHINQESHHIVYSTRIGWIITTFRILFKGHIIPTLNIFPQGILFNFTSPDQEHFRIHFSSLHPAFCQPAIFQDDLHEPNNVIAQLTSRTFTSGVKLHEVNSFITEALGQAREKGQI